MTRCAMLLWMYCWCWGDQDEEEKKRPPWQLFPTQGARGIGGSDGDPKYEGGRPHQQRAAGQQHQQQITDDDMLMIE